MTPVASTRGPLARRAVLAVVLLVGFYLLAIAIIAGLGGLVYWMLDVGERVPMKLVLVAVIGAGAILWGILPRVDRFPAPGPLLKEREHPRLFKILHEIADATQQAMPVEVFLVGDVNAWVAQRGGIMGVGSRRVMGLGLPLLQMLETRQLKAVLAHEFGHFHGGDVKLGPWIYKTRGAIDRTLNVLRQTESKVLHLPFQWYGNFFLRITQAISRNQEYQADALSARVVGVEPLISGLRAIYGAGLAYDPYLQTEYSPVLDAGYRAGLADGFARFLTSGDVANRIEEALETEMRTGEADAFDSHPALRDRVDALERLQTGGNGAQCALSHEDDPKAITLLDALPELEQQLLEFMLANSPGELKSIAWDDVGTAVYPGLWKASVEEHQDLLEGLTIGSVPATQAAMAEAVRAAYGANTEDAPHEELAPFLTQVIGSALASKLVHDGWTVVTSPGEALILRNGDTRFNPWARLDQVAAGEPSFEAWKEECRAAGLDEAEPLT